ncbi:hypothetical protein E5676_scaffold314G00540 [Cucumis melo var. makuwa]|uniref:Reverse transcriptase Ty1/copia-type domain-containing protein n=1 Tax=Cucumis melo var. makuwa TaxID=1194695 RepID=A0A5D3CAS7_CUCMM|nr:hypothetical protein E6C27_scaffold221G00570 [Cucumis melo var. makuwa]TYK08961.1 hypothetical protein E5676_scaffold314G00540 [Cucumis melo var. makuwa]
MYNVEDPSNRRLSSVDVNLWQEAINDEMDSLESNRTWHLVDLPLGCKAIGCKWVLRKKLKPDGSVDKYKARLVAKGFSADIYSCSKQSLIHQMDVKTAFLNGDLAEEIYMEQPEDQSHYIEKILKKYNYFDSKLACTPYDSSVKLFKNTGDSVNQSEYASIIGSLRYAANCTRSDIAYAVGLLCRFTSRPNLEHWNAIERVMRYLKKTQNLGLHCNKFPAVLEGDNDADWNSLLDDSNATTGYIFNIAGGAVAWKSKKQTILAQLTMESEMIALAAASEEASWLQSLLSEIRTWERSIPAILIHCDSTAAITKVQNRYYNGKRR